MIIDKLRLYIIFIIVFSSILIVQSLWDDTSGITIKLESQYATRDICDTTVYIESNRSDIQLSVYNVQLSAQDESGTSTISATQDYTGYLVDYEQSINNANKKRLYIVTGATTSTPKTFLILRYDMDINDKEQCPFTKTNKSLKFYLSLCVNSIKYGSNNRKCSQDYNYTHIIIDASSLKTRSSLPINLPVIHDTLRGLHLPLPSLSADKQTMPILFYNDSITIEPMTNLQDLAIKRIQFLRFKYNSVSTIEFTNVQSYTSGSNTTIALEDMNSNLTYTLSQALSNGPATKVTINFIDQSGTPILSMSQGMAFINPCDVTVGFDLGGTICDPNTIDIKTLRSKYGCKDGRYDALNWCSLPINFENLDSNMDSCAFYPLNIDTPNQMSTQLIKCTTEMRRTITYSHGLKCRSVVDNNNDNTIHQFSNLSLSQLDDGLSAFGTNSIVICTLWNESCITGNINCINPEKVAFNFSLQGSSPVTPLAPAPSQLGGQRLWIMETSHSPGSSFVASIIIQKSGIEGFPLPTSDWEVGSYTHHQSGTMVSVLDYYLKLCSNDKAKKPTILQDPPTSPWSPLPSQIDICRCLNTAYDNPGPLNVDPWYLSVSHMKTVDYCYTTNNLVDNIEYTLDGLGGRSTWDKDTPFHLPSNPTQDDIPSISINTISFSDVYLTSSADDSVLLVEVFFVSHQLTPSLISERKSVDDIAEWLNGPNQVYELYNNRDVLAAWDDHNKPSSFLLVISVTLELPAWKNAYYRHDNMKYRIYSKEYPLIVKEATVSEQCQMKQCNKHIIGSYCNHDTIQCECIDSSFNIVDVYNNNDVPLRQQCYTKCPCLNSGTCLYTEGSLSSNQLNYTCKCADGFIGPLCQTRDPTWMGEGSSTTTCRLDLYQPNICFMGTLGCTNDGDASSSSSQQPQCTCHNIWSTDPKQLEKNPPRRECDICYLLLENRCDSKGTHKVSYTRERCSLGQCVCAQGWTGSRCQYNAIYSDIEFIPTDNTLILDPEEYRKYLLEYMKKSMLPQHTDLFANLTDEQLREYIDIYNTSILSEDDTDEINTQIYKYMMTLRINPGMIAERINQSTLSSSISTNRHIRLDDTTPITSKDIMDQLYSQWDDITNQLDGTEISDSLGTPSSDGLYDPEICDNNPSDPLCPRPPSYKDPQYNDEYDQSTALDLSALIPQRESSGSSSKGTNIGMVIGIIVGACVIFIALLVLIIWMKRNKKGCFKNKTKRHTTTPPISEMSSATTLSPHSNNSGTISTDQRKGSEITDTQQQSLPISIPNNDGEMLPPGWSKMIDPVTSKKYYLNDTTLQSSWVQPNPDGTIPESSAFY